MARSGTALALCCSAYVTYAIEGFGVRLSPATPSVVVRQPTWQGDVHELAVHRLGVGTLLVTPTDDRAVVAARAGDRAQVAEVADGSADRDWRVRLPGFSFVLPPALALLVADPRSAVELRFAHVIASQSVAFPDGTAMPYGDDVAVLPPPEHGTLPSEEAMTRELELMRSALAAEGKRVIAAARIEGARRVELEVRGPRGEARHECQYTVALGGDRAVRLLLSVDAKGAEVGRTLMDAVVASMRAEPR